MEISYWQSRWRHGKTGWHMDSVYPLLKKYWPLLPLNPNAHVLVPLCGKSMDLKWLADQKFKVTGVDVVPDALQTICSALDIEFTSGSRYGKSVYISKNVHLWEADFLNFPVDAIESVDAIYDKAAIIALPPDKRKVYAEKILSICHPNTHILLQTFKYKQEEMHGPPFSVEKEELHDLFGRHFKLNLLHEESKLREVERFRRRGLSSYFIEKVYHLSPKNK